jgi:hypothetical protein
VIKAFQQTLVFACGFRLVRIRPNTARLIGHFSVSPPQIVARRDSQPNRAGAAACPHRHYYKDKDVADRSRSAERGLARPTGFDHDPIKLNQIVIASLCSA